MNSSKADPGLAYPSSRVAWRVTLLLTFAYMLSFVDRQVLNLLVDPIQSDLEISDTQVSLLQGFAFILTYILFSIPLGRLADTRSRTLIISAGVMFWSIATAACGLASSFKQLFATRAAVGMGEAALTPAAWSLIADYFPPERRSFAISVFLMGPYLGAGLSMILGGALMGLMAESSTIALPLLGESKPWQITFMVVGLPGVVVALLFLKIREPARIQSEQGLAVRERASYADLRKVLRSEASIYAALLVGIPLLVIILYGLQAWVPSYLVRSFGLSIQDAGLLYGTIALLAGSTGVLSGPVLGRWLASRGIADYPLRLGLFSSLAVCPFLLLLATTGQLYVALVSVVAASLLVTMPLALAASTLQTITPNTMRGLIAGIYVVMTSGVGMGLGPTLIALCTDYLLQDRALVGVSLAIVGIVVATAAALLFFRALKPFRGLEAAQTL